MTLIIIATALACLIISAIIGTTVANLVTRYRDRKVARHKAVLDNLLMFEV